MTRQYDHNRNAPHWAGQPARSSQQQWPGQSNAQPQLEGSRDFFDADVNRNPHTLIKEFNNDLPSFNETDLGQSPRLYVNGAQADYADLSFDAVFGISFEKHDIGIGIGGPGSCGPSRTISQASSNGKDELESVTFSQGEGEELYNTSFGDGIFYQINSPATTNCSEIIVSGNHSLENSPAVPRRSLPFLNLQTDTSSMSGNAMGYSASSSPASAHGFSTTGFPSQNTPTSAPRQSVSALSAGLSNYNLLHPSPTTVYFDNWSTQFSGDVPAGLGPSTWDSGMPSGDFVLFDQDPSGPSLVVHPPETSLMTSPGNDVGSLDAYATSGVHPIDNPLPTLSSPRPSSQDFMARGVSMPTPNHLVVPHGRPRRPSDPPRLRPSNTPITQAGHGRVQKVHGFPRMTVDRLSRASSPVNRPIQRLSQDRIRISGTTSPVNITHGTGRPAIVAEHPPSISPPTRQGPARGRRIGPMEAASRAQAKDTRNKKMVCIRCKHSKQACRRTGNSPESPCFQCEKHALSNKWPGPCVKAHFEDIVLSGSCNYISQRAINHLSLDGARRIRRELPKGFPLDGLIDTLGGVRNKFDIRVYQDGQTAYTLDLAKSYDYLLALKSQVGGSDRSFSSFIDIDLVRVDSKSDEWEACMTDVTIETDPLVLLCALNNMPSRARYSCIHTNAFGTRRETFMNPESPSESDYLMLAAQLSRIICRKVEVKAYTHLQRILHKSDSLSEAELLPLLQRLGLILFTLRWRFSWWAVMLGTSFIHGHDKMKVECQSRVQDLCRVLYFYYCSVRRKLATWSTVESLRGVFSRYPDTDCQIWDDFPGDETQEAFENWLIKGQKLIFESGAPRVLGLMGLPA